MRLDVPTSAGTGWVDLDRPRALIALLALTHGAGGGVETADLLAVRDAAVHARIAVALVTQPYRVAGRRTPPRPGPQDAAWRDLITALRRRRGLAGAPLVLGGRSNGARVACRTALSLGASAVVALAFPLLPPARGTRPSAGQPPAENSRLDELDGTGVPTLVVQGDRDPFGLPPAAPLREVFVVHGDHALKRDTARVAAAVTGFVTALSGVG